jgi:hypothetical protein
MTPTQVQDDALKHKWSQIATKENTYKKMRGLGTQIWRRVGSNADT